MAVGDKQYFQKEITSTNKLPADYLDTTDSTLWASKQDRLTVGTNIQISTDNTISATDTLNTAGSTDTSSKIYLVGATSQTDNSQTYSDNEVYVENGTLQTKSVNIAGRCNLVYDSTNKCINFIFN